MNPVVHFEMPADDRKRMADFYSNVFDWQTKLLGPEMGEYVLVTTTESETMPGMSGRPKQPGTINGGFYKRNDDPMSHHPSVVIAVDNIDESMKKVKAAGGTIHGEPYDIPGVGRYVSIIDTEGNRVSMLQPNAQMGATERE